MQDSVLTLRRKALQEAMARYGFNVVEPRSLQEKDGMHRAAVLTVLCTGNTEVSSLRDTALNGGC